MTERNTTESLKEFLGTFKRRMPKDVFIDMEAALSDIFPEIKKSENEKIRKALLDLFKIENFNGYTTLNGIDVDDVITWLEKQGEQKPAKWSEKDEKTWKELIEEVKDQLDSVPSPDCRDKEDEKALKQLTRWLVWIKSLKERLGG